MTTILRTEHLNKVFTTDNQEVSALRDINLAIEEGEIFGIIGVSGAGKSTLVRCLNLLEEPSSGEIYYRNFALTKLSSRQMRSLRRNIGMIFQHFNLLQQQTALKNVIFPLEINGVPNREAIERGHELLALVGLADRADAYPNQLSGGQKQRIAIARALAANPEIIMCDEATSALDPQTTDQILELLQKINREWGVTIIIITHQMEIVTKVCHRVAVMENSAIVEVGEVKKVFTDPQSAMAKRLILPQGELLRSAQGKSVIRLIFDGRTASAPILANLILYCQQPLSILAADSETIAGKTYGQMIVQLPDDKIAVDKILRYLDHNYIDNNIEVLPLCQFNTEITVNTGATLTSPVSPLSKSATEVTV